MDNTRLDHLEELKGSDFEIAEGMPDIQGWKIVNHTGEKIGKVKDMLFDKEARKVRYIITSLRDDITDLENREVLIPIGQADLDVTDKHVVVPNLTSAQLLTLPTYSKGEMTSEHEYAIRNTFLGTPEGGIIPGTLDAPYNRETFYNDDSFNEGRFYKKDENSNRSGDLSDAGETGSADLDRADDMDRAEVLDRPIESERTDDLDRPDDIDLTEDRNRGGEDPFGREANDPTRI